MPSGTPVSGSIFFPGRAKMRRHSRGKSRLDFDAIECLCFFLPFIPRRPVHVWNWGRDESTGHAFSSRRETYYSYRSMPIRWAPDLLVRALLRYWLWVPMLVSLPFSLSFAHSAGYKTAALIVFLVSLTAWVWLCFFDGGQKKIRRLLGRHRLGVSDPATWTDDLVRLIAPPQDWFKTRTFAEAVEPLLKERRYSEAMWAARLCLAVENEREGRLLTDDVLCHPEVRAVLGRIKAQPKRFKELVSLQHPQPFPLLRQEGSKAAAYWHSMVSDPTKEVFTMVTYAGHWGGVWAWGDDAAKEEEDESTRDDPLPPKDQLGPLTSRYRFIGSALPVAVLLSVIVFASASSSFQEATPAQKQFEEQRQLAAGQPAVVPPVPPPEEPIKKPPPAPLPAWAEREPGNWQYLADMQEFDAMVGKPWTFAKDGTTGDPEKHSPIKVGGAASPKGLGMHPPEATFSKVKYKLDRKAQRFKSVGAVADSSTLLFSPVYFEVWGDGQRLWQSERITQEKQIRECSIDVADVEVLELRAVAVGHHTGLHAVWLEPRVLMK